MSELGSGSRALINAARQVERISAEDKARIRSKINHRIATGIALGSVFTASTAAAKIGVWLPTAAKVLAIAVVSTSVGYVSLHRVMPHRAPPSRPAETAVNHRVPSRAPLDRGRLASTAPAVSVESAAPAASVAATADAASAGSIAAPHVTQSPPAGSGVAGPKPAPSLVASHKMEVRHPRNESKSPVAAESLSQPSPDSDLARQVAAIRESRAAARRGDAEAALAALERATTDGQTGPLEQELILTQIAAHCLKGNHRAARELASSFLSRFPQSPLGRRVRESCAWDPNDQP